MKTLLVACCLIFVVTQTINADIAKPKPPVQPAKITLHTSLEIATDPKAYEAKLQIPQSELQNLRAALDGGAGNATVVGGIALSSTRTIIAGLLMFLSVSIAGVLFARSSSFGRTQKVVGTLVLVAAMLGATAIITQANAGPPGSYRWRNLPQALAEGKPTYGGVDVEIVPDDPNGGGRIRLIIPLKKQNGNGEE